MVSVLSVTTASADEFDNILYPADNCFSEHEQKYNALPSPKSSDTEQLLRLYDKTSTGEKCLTLTLVAQDQLEQRGYFDDASYRTKFKNKTDEWIAIIRIFENWQTQVKHHNSEVRNTKQEKARLRAEKQKQSDKEFRELDNCLRFNCSEAKRQKYECDNLARNKKEYERRKILQETGALVNSDWEHLKKFENQIYDDCVNKIKPD